MVLAIDIGNTTIAFTGLEKISAAPEDNFSEKEHRDDTLSESEKTSAAPEDRFPQKEHRNDSLSGLEKISAAPDTSSVRNLPVTDLKIIFSEKIPTETGKDPEVFLKEAKAVLAGHGIGIGDKLVTNAQQKLTISAVAISSVVPACTQAAKIFSEKICKNPPVIINWRCNTGLSFDKIPAPDRVGADRIADASWAAFRYPLPVMTVDMGTATTINIVSKNREFLGGMIGTGVQTALHSLRTGTAQLPELQPCPVPPEKLIGTDTSGCMLSAAVVGTAAMVDGLAAHVEDQIGSSLNLILTGGNARNVSAWIRHSHIYEPGLAAKGSALIALREANIVR